MVSDTSLDARFCNHPAVSGQPGIRSYLGTPIIGTDGQILGALCAVDFKPRSFTPDQQRLLATFADLVMNEFELRQVASVDALTGLATRRAFVEKLETVARWDTKASLICVDLDRFKAINDTYGHPVGDDVLRTVSRAIMDCCDVNAFAGRLGGEELAVVLSGTDGIEAAERIRRAIEQARLARFPDLTFTASVGVASRMPGMDQHAWLAAADAALYDAKKSGRNCVRYSVPALSGV